MFSKPLGSVYIETVIYSQAQQIFVHVIFPFIRNVFGNVLNQAEIILIPINLYLHPTDFAKLFLEVIYLGFILYFLIQKLKIIFKFIEMDFEIDFLNDS